MVRTGYDPEGPGGLDSARALEDFVVNAFIKLAPTFYCFAPPGELQSSRNQGSRRVAVVPGLRRASRAGIIVS
jgi:hypothetical protein